MGLAFGSMALLLIIVKHYIRNVSMLLIPMPAVDQPRVLMLMVMALTCSVNLEGATQLLHLGLNLLLQPLLLFPRLHLLLFPPLHLPHHQTAAIPTTTRIAFPMELVQASLHALLCGYRMVLLIIVLLCGENALVIYPVAADLLNVLVMILMLPVFHLLRPLLLQLRVVMQKVNLVIVTRIAVNLDVKRARKHAKNEAFYCQLFY